METTGNTAAENGSQQAEYISDVMEREARRYPANLRGDD